MGRWEPNARERLIRAALDLFVEVGFADATVPRITARAGLTTRTFFRYFTDKREVLFAAEQELPAVVAQMMSEAPPGLTPLQLVEHGLRIVAVTRLEPNRDYLRVRRAVIRGDEGLVERDLRKAAILIDTVRRELMNSGVNELTATLTAHLTSTVLGVSVDRWLDQTEDQPLVDVLDHTLSALKPVIGDSARAPVARA